MTTGAWQEALQKCFSELLAQRKMGASVCPQLLFLTDEAHSFNFLACLDHAHLELWSSGWRFA